MRPAGGPPVKPGLPFVRFLVSARENWRSPAETPPRALARRSRLTVGATSTFALGNVTLPFIVTLADKGWKQALRDDPHLRNGLNVCEGQVTCAPVAGAHGMEGVDPESFL